MKKYTFNKLTKKINNICQKTNESSIAMEDLWKACGAKKDVDKQRILNMIYEMHKVGRIKYNYANKSFEVTQIRTEESIKAERSYNISIAALICSFLSLALTVISLMLH